MASEQFVENRAESVDICGAADSCIVTDRLLGRHVTGRSHYLLRARDGAPMFHQPGEAEISQVRFAVSVQQNISWLDVSMQNAVFVCVVHSAGDFRDEFCCLPGRYRTMIDDFVEPISFNKPHAEVARPIALANLVDGNDPRIIKLRRRFRFPAKAFQVRVSGKPTNADDLYRDRAAKAPLPGAEYDALTAATNLLQ